MATPFLGHNLREASVLSQSPLIHPPSLCRRRIREGILTNQHPSSRCIRDESDPRAPPPPEGAAQLKDRPLRAATPPGRHTGPATSATLKLRREAQALKTSLQGGREELECVKELECGLCMVPLPTLPCPFWSP